MFCHAFDLTSIVHKCTDTPNKQSTLYFGANSEKTKVQIMNFATPDYTDTYSYILVHTSTY
jgi:hypothetical protein